MKKLLRRLLIGFGGLCLLLSFLWATGAVVFLTYLPEWLAGAMALLYFVEVVVSFFRIKDRRIWRYGMMSSFIAVYLLTLPQQPSTTRDWAADNAQFPTVTFDEDDVTIDGFRHSVYRSESDFDVNFQRLSFRLSELDQVWFVVQRFTALEGIAHNFLTFRVNSNSGPKYFSVSIEVRREQGESFSPIRGLYRQYELIYVIADERDEIGSRTVMRPQDRVYMYPVHASASDIQKLFVHIAQRIDTLNSHPEFYHSLLNNCTNSIVLHAYDLTPNPINWLDPRIVAPGFADRLAYSEHLIGNRGESFQTLKSRCRIDEIARKAGITPAFSEDIRAGLPE